MYAINRVRTWGKSQFAQHKNYRLEVETNSVKKRVGVYVMNGIKSIRNYLEGVDSNLLIFDIRGE